MRMQLSFAGQISSHVTAVRHLWYRPVISYSLTMLIRNTTHSMLARRGNPSNAALDSLCKRSYLAHLESIHDKGCDIRTQAKTDTLAFMRI